MRKVQLIDTELLRIVTEVLEKNNLIYWLDWGTLLGAIRHKGFVPWDDDLDIAMPFYDYKIARNILSDELKPYGFSVVTDHNGSIGILDWKAGAILDIFEVDNVKKTDVIKKDEFINKYQKFAPYYINNINRISYNQMQKEKELELGSFTKSGESLLWYQYFTPEKPAIYNDEDLFPLSKVIFEGYYFNCPKKFDRYLTEEYGDYMKFPTSGILHHHGDNKRPIYMNSIKYKLNIDEHLEKLRKIDPLKN